MLRELKNYLVWRLILRQPRMRRFLQRALFPDRDEIVTLFGARLCANSQLEFGYWRSARLAANSQALRDEIPFLLLFASLARPGATFVDAGANVGLWSANMARLAPLYAGLRVLSFEPNPATFRRLERTAAFYDCMTPVNCALSDEVRTLKMVQGAVSSVFAPLTENSAATAFHLKDEPVEIEAKPLDSFLDGHDDILMKIDVEGHEREVMAGAARAFAERRVRALYIDMFEPDARAAILAQLAAAGLTPLDAATLEPFGSESERILAVRWDEGAANA